MNYPAVIIERAKALRNRVLWESNGSIEIIAEALWSERQDALRMFGGEDETPRHYGDMHDLLRSRHPKPSDD